METERTRLAFLLFFLKNNKADKRNPCIDANKNTVDKIELKSILNVYLPSAVYNKINKVLFAN